MPKSLNGYLLNPGELLRSASISGSMKIIIGDLLSGFGISKESNLHISKNYYLLA
jgi:hypothetical protein